MKSYFTPEAKLFSEFPFNIQGQNQYGIGCIENIQCVLDTTPDALSDCAGPTCVEIDLRASNACNTSVSALAWGPDGAGGSLSLDNASEIPFNTEGGTYPGSVAPLATVDLTDDDTDFDLTRTPGEGFSLEFQFTAGGETGTVRCEFQGSDGNGAATEGEIL